MKSLIALVLLTLAPAAHAAVDAKCWDGTFAYNRAHVVETSRGIEVSVTGSTVAIPSTVDAFGNIIPGFNGSWSLGETVYLVLPNTPVVNGATTTWEAKAEPFTTADGWQDVKYPALWVQHDIVNLSKAEQVLTDIRLKDVQVELSDSLVKITLTQADKKNAKAETFSIDCRNSGFGSGLTLPQALIDHLDGKDAAANSANK